MRRRDTKCSRWFRDSHDYNRSRGTHPVYGPRRLYSPLARISSTGRQLLINPIIVRSIGLCTDPGTPLCQRSIGVQPRYNPRFFHFPFLPGPLSPASVSFQPVATIPCSSIDSIPVYGRVDGEQAASSIDLNWLVHVSSSFFIARHLHRPEPSVALEQRRDNSAGWLDLTRQSKIEEGKYFSWGKFAVPRGGLAATRLPSFG